MFKPAKGKPLLFYAVLTVSILAGSIVAYATPFNVTPVSPTSSTITPSTSGLAATDHLDPRTVSPSSSTVAPGTFGLAVSAHLTPQPMTPAQSSIAPSTISLGTATKTASISAGVIASTTSSSLSGTSLTYPVRSQSSSLPATTSLSGTSTKYPLVRNTAVQPTSITLNGVSTDPPVARNPGQPDLWTDVIGRERLMLGRTETYLINVGNSGDVDAFDVILLIKVPAVLHFTIDLPVPTGSGVDWSHAPVDTVIGSERIVPVWIHSIEKFSARQIVMTLKAQAPSQVGDDAPITAEIFQPTASLFSSTGSSSDIASSIVFSSLTATYSAVKDKHPGELGMEVVEFQDQLESWLQDNENRLQVDSHCLLAMDATSEILGSSLAGIPLSDFCEESIPAIYGPIQNLGEIHETIDYLSNTNVVSEDWISQLIPRAYADPSLAPPLPGWGGRPVISPFGPRDDPYNPGVRERHEAWDVAVPENTPVSAAHGGKVTCYTDSNGSRNIEINGDGVNTYYGHLNGFEKSKCGNNVNQGDRIGKSGVTGVSCMTPHLHFAVLDKTKGVFVDPADAGLPTPSGDPNDPNNIPSNKSNCGDKKTTKPGKIVASRDPNEKIGPQGFGTNGFISYGQELTYVIYFENLASATAPAEKIVITDQLDPDLDWGSLTITGSSHPSKLQTQYDSTTGRITLTFNNINLPPNVNPPEGQGWASFKVKHKSGIASGTAISNEASITFDFNAPIGTGAVLNTIDSVAPESSITPLAPVQSSNVFSVHWSGSDAAGSGIDTFDIFVSKDGGAFLPFLFGIEGTSAQFEGDSGHSYSFYSIATDNVGNEEERPAQPDATTTIQVANHPPVALDDTATTLQGDPVNISVLTNDTDVDGSSLSIQSVGVPSHGVAIKNADGTITYTPNDAFFGQDQFTYSVTDGSASDDAAVFVTVIQTTFPDNTPPLVEGSADRAPDSNNWYNHTLTIDWQGDDGTSGSGISECDPATHYSGPDGESIMIEGHCTDNSGNTGTGTIAINYDQTPPELQSFDGSIRDGNVFVFGQVPSNNLSCIATDGTSGLDGACKVTGYSTAVGVHTLVASAKDIAGNLVSQTVQYTVTGWTIKGFYQPIDMNGVVNTVKNGASVPFKFEIFAGATEMTSTGADVIKSFTQKKISCSTLAGDPTDSVEEVLNSGTSLKYDPVAGQYVRVWQTPKSANTCWEITLTAADNAFINAYIKLK